MTFPAYHRRTWLFTVGCLLCLLGCSSDKPPGQPSATLPTSTPPSQRMPLELVSSDGKLGTADFGDSRSCEFRIRNNQTEPVTLKLIDKSCTCTGVQLPDAPIEPGREAKVILNWSPKVEKLERSSIRLWAKVGDPGQMERVILEATGNIEPKVMVGFPRGPLDFGKLALADLAQDRNNLVVEVYSQQTSFPVPVSKVNTPGIEVVQTEPLTSDRLTTLAAGSGYRLTLRPTRQLPHGAFVAQLAVQTALKPNPLVMDVSGSLETSIVSLSPDKVQLPPRLSLQTGYRVPALTMTIRYGECKSCEIVDVSPKLFDGRVVKVDDKTWRIELSMSKESSALQQRFTPGAWEQLMKFGFEQGSIILKLDHPEVKSLTIPIAGAELSRE